MGWARWHLKLSSNPNHSAVLGLQYCFAIICVCYTQAAPLLPALFDNRDQTLWALLGFVRLVLWHDFCFKHNFNLCRASTCPRDDYHRSEGQNPPRYLRLSCCSAEPLHIPPCCTAFMQHGASWCVDVYLLSVLPHWCLSQLKCFPSDCGACCSPLFVQKISYSRKAAAKRNSSSVLYLFLPKNITQLGQLL